MTPFIASILSAFLLLAPGQTPAQNSFRIVVVEGEDAVNIIQQKTAVAPIVEIRDRNNLPVAGATVTFTIGGQGASFGGLSTLTVTTNAAGQAAAVGLTPTAAGAIQINASALVQGQALSATITQTNFMTAAQAASAASATGSAGGAGGSGGAAGGAGGGGGAGAGAAGGAAGGAGGGLGTGALVGIVGGAVAGGALIATQVGGGGDDAASTSATSSTTTPTTTTPTTTTPTTPQTTTVTYNGPLAGTFTSTGTADTVSCSFTYAMTGAMRIVLETRSDGSVSGPATGTMSFRESSAACNVPFLGVDPDGGENGSIPFSGNVTGTAGSLRFSQVETQNIPVSGGSVSTRFETAFSGAVSGGAITGQLILTSSSTFSIPGLNLSGRGNGSSTVTLRP
jgi:hypothetical protein